MQIIGESRVPVFIVTGPPASGKTTFVREKAQHGDLIVDVDTLYMALSGLTWYEKPDTLLPFVMEARDAVIRRLARESDVRHAWIITSEARVSELAKLRDQLGATLVVMETSAMECKRRLREDERRSRKAELWDSLVDKWWRTYNRDELSNATVITG